MSIDSIEQLATVLSLIGGGAHQVWTLSKRIHLLEGKLDLVSTYLKDHTELSEITKILRTRQDYLEQEIKDLQKYN